MLLAMTEFSEFSMRLLRRYAPRNDGIPGILDGIPGILNEIASSHSLLAMTNSRNDEIPAMLLAMTFLSLSAL